MNNNTKRINKKSIIKYLTICFGVLVYSIGVKWFVYNANVLPSGLTGLSRLIQIKDEIRYCKGKIGTEQCMCPQMFVRGIKYYGTDDDIFALGILSKALESQGMVTAIEKNNDKDSQESAKTTLQFLVNGMSDKSKYNLHFDFGKEKNNKLLEDENERKKFHDKLRKKLSKEYNINEEDIIITFPRRGSYQVTIIFKSQDFKLNEEELIKKLKEDKDELSKLKKIESGIILEGCKLTPSMLDYRGNNKDGGWAGKGEKRGNEEYIPPTGWIGYGLKVMDVYEDNTWLGKSNCEGEWCVAYHGVADGKSPEEVSKITGKICKGGFKPSTSGKATYDEDLRHPGKKCGLGVYCSPDIDYAARYAGITELNKEKYKCVLMLRVNPDKIRQSTSWPKEYILEPNIDEIRPYRILLKKVI